MSRVYLSPPDVPSLEHQRAANHRRIDDVHLVNVPPAPAVRRVHNEDVVSLVELARSAPR